MPAFAYFRRIEGGNSNPTQKTMAKKAPKKYYALRKGNKENAVFTGRSPRQAALKAAARGETSIVLRERGRRNQDGTYTLHKFKGGRRKEAAPENRPDWLPEKIWRAFVKKQGIQRIDEA